MVFIIRSLIEKGEVKERFSKVHLEIIRSLIGQSTNLNQLAKQANAQGFFRISKECEAAAKLVSQLINTLKDDR